MVHFKLMFDIPIRGSIVLILGYNIINIIVFLGFGLGVAFGYFPARKAAKSNPIDA